MPSWLTTECEKYSDVSIIYSNCKYDPFTIYFYMLIDISDYISDLSMIIQSQNTHFNILMWQRDDNINFDLAVIHTHKQFLLLITHLRHMLLIDQ